MPERVLRETMREPKPADAWQAADWAARDTLENGGGTFDARTLANVTPPHRYAVAIIPNSHAVQVRDPERTAAIPRAILAMRREYPDAPYIGTWRNNATGLVHVDPVVAVPDLESARIIGRALGQLALYDFEAGEDFELYRDDNL